MRHVILSILMWLLANVAHAFEIEDRAVFGDETDSAPLRIVSPQISVISNPLSMPSARFALM